MRLHDLRIWSSASSPVYEEAEFHRYQVINLCEQNKNSLCIQIKRRGEGGGRGKQSLPKLCVSRTRGLYFFYYSLGFRGVSPLSRLLSFQFCVVGWLGIGVFSTLRLQSLFCINCSGHKAYHLNFCSFFSLTLIGMQLTGGNVKACLNKEIAQASSSILAFQTYTFLTVWMPVSGWALLKRLVCQQLYFCPSPFQMALFGTSDIPETYLQFTTWYSLSYQ